MNVITSKPLVLNVVYTAGLTNSFLTPNIELSGVEYMYLYRKQYATVKKDFHF